MSIAKILIILSLVLLQSTYGYTQDRAEFLNQPASILLPDNYTPSRSYPLIIFLPPANATAAAVFEQYVTEMPSTEYIILAPEGAPSNRDFLPDFGQFTKWFEERLLLDIAMARKKYKIDSKHIILIGHSLGGDLAWALTARNPKLFSGFIVSGTRCSYALSKTNLQMLKSSGFRGAFFIGDQDQAQRINGIKAGYTLFKKSGIESNLQLIAHAGHTLIPQELFIKSLDWILDTQDGRKGTVP